LDAIRVEERLTIANGAIYCDDFLLGEATGYISDLSENFPLAMNLKIERINRDRLSSGKVLCHARIDAKILIPFEQSQYKPLVELLTEAVV
jgi:hypothetical protein